MKATGIVRRIDDLGRIVVPKEIRRTMRIREGDPLEIFTDSDGEVIFKKYSPIGEMGKMAAEYCEVLSKCTPFSVIICDRDHCIAAAGISKNSVLERRISSHLEKLMDERQTYVYTKNDSNQPLVLEDFDRKASVIMPIITAGDISGAVVLISAEQLSVPSESDMKLVSVAAAFLGKQMEQ